MKSKKFRANKLKNYGLKLANIIERLGQKIGRAIAKEVGFYIK